jgi:hypothetical protein
MSQHIFRALPLLGGILLVAAAAAHRAMLGGPRYTGHWLIVVEVLLALALLLLVVAQGLYAVVLLFTWKWRKLLLTIALLVATLILLYAGIAIDSPTLLYAS